jgi:hypothetical protein
VNNFPRHISNTLRLALPCLVLGALGIYNPSIAHAETKVSQSATLTVVQIVDLLVADWEGISGGNVPVLDGRTDVLDEVEKRWPALSVTARMTGVGYIQRFGRDPLSPTYKMKKTKAIAFLVKVYLRDPSPKVQHVAANLLAWDVADASIRLYAADIIKAFGNRIVLKQDALVLGKLGDEASVRILRAARKKQSQKNDLTRNIDLALSKLGDTKRECEFINAFEKACKPRKRSSQETLNAIYAIARHARLLGYIGQPGSVAGLARQFRNPLNHRAEGSDYLRVISVRFAIVSALGIVWPDNKLFHFPYSKSNSSETDYIKVEVWLKAYLGTTWALPRPAFTEESIRFHMMRW